MSEAPTVSIRDVAELAGVALGTVSNVLNRPEKVAPATRERVLSAIAELGFVRNDAARQLRAGRSRSVGLVVLDVRNPFFTDVARGAEDRAAQQGLAILLANSDESRDRESRHIDLFEEQRVHGLLISPIGEVFPRLDRLREHGTPSVLVDRFAGDHAYSSVSVDDVAGGRMAVNHLIEQGRRRLAFVGGPVGIPQIADRLKGARAATRRAKAGLEVLTVASPTVQEGRACGEQLIRRAPADRPDAIFAANDLLAVGLLQAFVSGGRLRVPDDIAMIGYDDIDFATSSVVPLSSVRQPSALMGETAIELLLEEVEAIRNQIAFEHRQVVFQPELVVRESSQTALSRDRRDRLTNRRTSAPRCRGGSSYSE